MTPNSAKLPIDRNLSKADRKTSSSLGEMHVVFVPLGRVVEGN